MGKNRYNGSMKNETKRRIAACASGFALPRYADIPHVGLYLDQTVQYVNGYFSAFAGVELTGSMVSNYVKKGLIPHPIKKKYTREQIASLIYVVVAKNVLSIENIEMLFKIQREHCSAEVAYNSFCAELEACLPYVFGLRNAVPPLDPNAGDEKLLLRSTIISAANKMYLDCYFKVVRQEQAFWPGILADLQ